MINSTKTSRAGRRSVNLVFLTILLYVGMAAGAAAQAPAPFSAENASASHNRLLWLSDFRPMPNSSSTMLRNRHGVTLSVNTAGLEPDAAFTVWFLVFNNPEFCAGTAELNCSPLVGDLGNPAVDASAFWGAGRVSDFHGQLDIHSTIFAGGDVPGQRLFGPGLLHATKADIHIIVRSHGSAATLQAAGQLGAALTTIEGGCGINACEDVQAVVHQP